MIAPAQPLASKTGFGVTAINRIGALTVAIGIIFFFKYAVDAGFIGAAAGVTLGSLFGLALVAAADWFERRGQPVFAQGLAGCGLASLYISVYAAFGFYRLMGQAGGFAGLILVAAVAFGLSLRFSSAAIATLAVLGALLAPLLLHNSKSPFWITVAYLTLVNVTSAAIAVQKEWRFVAAAAGPLSLLCAWILLEPKEHGSFVIVSSLLAVLYFWSASRSRANIRVAAYIVGHLCILIATLRLLSLTSENPSLVSLATSILLLTYAIATMTYGVVERSSTNRYLGLALIGASILKLYLYDVWQLSKTYRITAFLGLGALLLVASWLYSRTARPKGRAGL